MIIKILGTGCSSCKKLESHVKEAVEQMSLDATIEKVTDLKSIMAYGVMKTPAMVVDEKVMISGRVPKVKEIIRTLKS